jgi:hypothetical protein
MEWNNPIGITPLQDERHHISSLWGVTAAEVLLWQCDATAGMCGGMM